MRITLKSVLHENAVSEATCTVLLKTVNDCPDYELEKVEVQPAPTQCVFWDQEVGGGAGKPGS